MYNLIMQTVFAVVASVLMSIQCGKFIGPYSRQTVFLPGKNPLYKVGRHDNCYAFETFNYS